MLELRLTLYVGKSCSVRQVACRRSLSALQSIRPIVSGWVAKRSVDCYHRAPLRQLVEHGVHVWRFVYFSRSPSGNTLGRFGVTAAI